MASSAEKRSDGVGYNWQCALEVLGRKSMGKIVRKRPAVKINRARKRRFEKLAQMPDSEIDFSEIPELTEKFWKNAVRNPYYMLIKKQLKGWDAIPSFDDSRNVGRCIRRCKMRPAVVAVGALLVSPA
jgi:hypothetical protein